MITPRPRLGKKGVAWLLGCSVSEVKRLIADEQLRGSVLCKEGEGWIAYTGSQGRDLFFTVEEIVAFRADRRKWKRSESQEGDPSQLPLCPLPTVGITAAALLLGISEQAVRKQVGRGIRRAYVLNLEEIGWTPYHAEDASPRGTLGFCREDL